MTRHLHSAASLLLALLCSTCHLTSLAAASDGASDDVSSLPHVDDCNYCIECLPTHPTTTTTSLITSQPMSSTSRRHRALLQDSALHPASLSLSPWATEPDSAYEAAAAASGISGALTDPHLILPELIGPADEESKQHKPNCTRCRGCSAVLTDMHAEPVRAAGLGGPEGLTFMHGKGATNGWLFFGRVAGSSKRYVVKVYCMPYSKMTGRPQVCHRRVYTERLRLMVAQMRLAGECGAGGITPRVWVAPVHATIPNGTFTGYHVRWHGLWMEEAPGISLHALWDTKAAQATLHELLARRLNTSQVVQQTVLDLLTAQCDRHSENVFVTPAGDLSFIDNDRALGVVTRCGSDSMLLPGDRYHTQLRLGYWGPVMELYRHNGSDPGFCTGPIDMRVLMDYRCYLPGGRLGHNYPPGLKACMRALARHPVPEIMARYGFTTSKPAEILKRRARDMLTLGFETALVSSPPRSAARYVYTPQPPCCEVVLDPGPEGGPGTPRCATCWKPVVEDNKDAVKGTSSAAVDVLVGPDE